ncbi:MAG: NUDIX domain-containing protein [Clostridia bacterium]|nr:NUDIX domain-containing protein [Clostridia bacterium]
MELWNLYTPDRQNTGLTMQRGDPVPEGLCHLVVHVVIFNSRGEMLIQQRQPFKAGWPNLWDVTVGGSAVAGDSSQSAAEREVLEEIGLPIDLTGNRPKLTIHFNVGFDDIYTLVQDVDLNALTLQESEVQAVKWAGEEEIQQMIREGSFIPYHSSLISLLFALRDQRGTITHRRNVECPR